MEEETTIVQFSDSPNSEKYEEEMPLTEEGQCDNNAGALEYGVCLHPFFFFYNCDFAIYFCVFGLQSAKKKK